MRKNLIYQRVAKAVAQLLNRIVLQQQILRSYLQPLQVYGVQVTLLKDPLPLIVIFNGQTLHVLVTETLPAECSAWFNVMGGPHIQRQLTPFRIPRSS